MREIHLAPATPGGGDSRPPYQGPRIRAETSATSAERRWTRPRRYCERFFANVLFICGILHV